MNCAITFFPQQRQCNKYVPQPRHLPRPEACRDRLRRLRPLRQPARAPDTAGRRPGYHPPPRHPGGGGGGPLRRCLDGRAKARSAHAELRIGKLRQCPGLARSALWHSPSNDHQPPRRQGRADSWPGAHGPAHCPLLQTLDIPYQAPASGEGEEAVVASWEEAQEKRHPAAVLLDLDYWRRA